MYDVADSVATITLHRPERMNAFTGVMMHEVIDAFDQVDADDDVRAVIVTGSGDGRSAPAPTSAPGATPSPTAAATSRPTVGVPRDGGGMVSLRIFDCTKPVIGAINGAAVGVGVTMTLPMDIRLASDTARFGFVFARRGIVPEAVLVVVPARGWSASAPPPSGATPAGCSRPPRRSSAAWFAACMRPTTCCPPPGRLAREIADNTAPVSVALTRQMLWRMLGADHPMEAHRVDSPRHPVARRERRRHAKAWRASSRSARRSIRSR